MEKQINTQYKWKLRWINEYKKNNGREIHLTPTLTYAQVEKENEFGKGEAKGIGIEWLVFALVLWRYQTKTVT